MAGRGQPLVRGDASTVLAAPAPLLALGAAIERADATARVLEAHLSTGRDELRPGDPDEARMLWAACDGGPSDPRLTLAGVVDRLTAERAHPASIAHALAEARDAARIARDALPAELVDMLAATRARLPRKVVEPRVGDFLVWVRERAALAVGLVESAVARDGTYELVGLGRHLERAAATARLLAAHADAPEASPQWMHVLRAAGAHEPHVRAHRGPPTAAAAIELLVLDERFPRSTAHALGRAHALLAGLTDGPLREPGRLTDRGTGRATAAEALTALAAACASSLALGVVVDESGMLDSGEQGGARVDARLDARVDRGSALQRLHVTVSDAAVATRHAVAEPLALLRG